MATKIHDFRIDEISFVNKGANKHARVTLLKRASDFEHYQENSMSDFTKKDSAFEALVLKRRAQNPGENEHDARNAVADTAEGKRAYREAMAAKDAHFAQQSSTCCYGGPLE